MTVTVGSKHHVWDNLTSWDFIAIGLFGFITSTRKDEDSISDSELKM